MVKLSLIRQPNQITKQRALSRKLTLATRAASKRVAHAGIPDDRFRQPGDANEDSRADEKMRAKLTIVEEKTDLNNAGDSAKWSSKRARAAASGGTKGDGDAGVDGTAEQSKSSEEVKAEERRIKEYMELHFGSAEKTKKKNEWSRWGRKGGS